MKIKEYLKRIENISKERIAYVNEMGIDTCIYREYGYTPKGKVYQNLSTDVSTNEWELSRLNLIKR